MSEPTKCDVIMALDRALQHMPSFGQGPWDQSCALLVWRVIVNAMDETVKEAYKEGKRDARKKAR